MNDIERITHEVVDAAIELKIVSAPATFKRKLVIREGRSDWRCTGGIDWKKDRPQVTYGKDWLAQKHSKIVEYDRVKDDPEIGSYSGTNEEVTRVMVCHEVAHAIDYWNWRCIRRQGRKPIPHGSEWRYRYRKLRQFFGLINKQDLQDAA